MGWGSAFMIWCRNTYPKSDPMKSSAASRGSSTRRTPAFAARSKYPETSANARRGGVSGPAVSNGITSAACRARSCICTARFAESVRSANGTHSAAIRPSTMRGSVEASTVARSRMHCGMATVWRIDWSKRACFESKCRRMAAGVTPTSPAMAASVAFSKPFSVKMRRAASRICSREIVGGRPICK